LRFRGERVAPTARGPVRVPRPPQAAWVAADVDAYLSVAAGVHTPSGSAQTAVVHEDKSRESVASSTEANPPWDSGRIGVPETIAKSAVIVGFTNRTVRFELPPSGRVGNPTSGPEWISCGPSNTASKRARGPTSLAALGGRRALA
jgi:hypothetical protein